MKTNQLPSEYQSPKSWCFCGHQGDGPASQHGGINGHGACKVEGCDCQQFTWKGWTKDFQAKLDKDKAREQAAAALWKTEEPQGMKGIIRALELAIDRLELNDGEGEEQEFIGIMQEAIRDCLAFEEAHLIDDDGEYQATETNYV